MLLVLLGYPLSECSAPVAAQRILFTETVECKGPQTAVAQVHDEFVLEGPIENKDEAKRELVRLMSHPFGGEEEPHGGPLSIVTDVDCGSGATWHDAKPSALPYGRCW